MPAFQTPGPITVLVEVGVGDVRIAASERTDTVVDVRPTDPASRADVAAAKDTRVEYANGRLAVRAPKSWKTYTPWGGGASIDVDIAVPSGSALQADVAAAKVCASGPLGECRCKTAAGDIDIEDARSIDLRTAAGDVTVGSAAGDASVTTGSGSTRIACIDGAAHVKNSNGDTWIGEVTGDVQVRAANGRIIVERAHASVSVRTAHGDVRIGEVARGEVGVHTGFGRVDVGVRAGVAAWLDLSTGLGRVESSLESAERPRPGEPTVEVRARSGFGDITIRRAEVAAVAAGR